jgi:predicted metalloendopeptidase
VILLIYLFNGCITPEKVINKVQTDPKFSVKMQEKFTQIFPCKTKDSLIYVPGTTQTDTVEKERSVTVYITDTLTNTKDSIVYIYKPGKLRVDTIKVYQSDERRVDNLIEYLNKIERELNITSQENEILKEQKSKIKSQMWALGASALIAILFMGFIIFKKKTSII